MLRAWALLGALLHETDRTEEAIACYLRVVELEPANVGGWSGLGAAYARIGNVAKGAEAYKRSIMLQPDLPGTHMSLAHELKTLGKQAEALREYRAAIALKPDFGEAYWSMANLKVFRFEPAEVKAMEEAAEARGPQRECQRPFPICTRQGLRRCGRLRPGLGALRDRQPAAAAARIVRSRGIRVAA